MSTTPTPVRVALAGCGRIARVHCQYLSGLPNVRLVAACDPIEGAADALAAQFHIGEAHRDLGQMLREVKPDVVHVLTPPATHADVGVAALEAGAHVLAEKPLALSTAEADRMVTAAARAGRTLAVDHNRWFDPVVQRAVALWESGELGELVGVDVFQGAVVGDVQAVARGERNHWSRDLPGGVMHDLAPHPAYLVRNAVGPIDDVQAEALWHEGVLQEVRALVRGERCLGTMTISMRARPFTNSLKLIGTRCTAEVNLNNMTLIVRRERRVPKLVGKVLPNLEESAQLLASTLRNAVAFALGRQRFFPGMGILIERFYRHLTAGTPAPTTGQDGRDVVCLLDALWRRAGEERELRASA